MRFALVNSRIDLKYEELIPDLKSAELRLFNIQKYEEAITGNRFLKSFPDYLI